jgi:predicted short-subunit dehydrogenase-like oxidoreductase (DUF2520 family)
MNSRQPLGLVVEGNATSSLVLRLPGLAEELGPIKAGALRVARRLSNYLRAGYAVAEYEELAATRLILLRVPDAITPRIVNEICESELEMKDLSFILCESWLCTKVLAPLRERGACIATVLPVQSLRKNWFVMEGDATAVRQMKKFLRRNDSHVFELRPGTKALYFAAQLFAMAFPIELFANAQQALRTAGISGNHLYDLLEEMSFEMFRSFANGVRLSWPTARTGCSPQTSAEYLQELRLKYPQIATVLDQEMTLRTHSAP